jgi:hypothetical protein
LHINFILIFIAFRLPDHQQNDIESNFLKISQKTDEVHNISSEQYMSKQLKLLSERVKNYAIISLSNSNNNNVNDISKSTEKTNDGIVTKESGTCGSSSCVKKLIEACQDDVVNLEQLDMNDTGEEQINAEFYKHSNKRILDSVNIAAETGGCTIKKVRVYESPLEFLNSDSQRANLSKYDNFIFNAIFHSFLQYK